jgi:anaerobic magnesium-protoporphyrin IX monomethyl ester cyclase
VSLIIPPSIFLVDERVFMNLGVLRVAAALEKSGYLVEVLDLSAVANYEEVVAIHAANTQARYFGITATTPQFPSCVKICAAVRAVRPDARLILGGPHATLANTAYKRERKLGISGRASRAVGQAAELFDVLVAGDGEDAIEPALTTTDKIVDADNTSSPMFLSDERFTELPFPARHLVDVNSYRYKIDGEPATSLIAQLGCPFACGFCSGRTSPMLRKIRLRSTESVIEELRQLYQVYGFRGFMFYDDELNVNPRMIELMQAITDEQDRLGVGFKLRGCIKAQLFTDAQAAAMKRAGFRFILVGFESGSPRILENINKKATRDENTRCFEIARRHGLKVKALMSIGHPGESQETVRQTLDWLLEIKPDEFNVTIITCTPGTFYYDHAVLTCEKSGVWTYTYPKTGDRLHSYDIDYREVMDYYNGNPDVGYRSFVFTDFLSPNDLVFLRDKIERTVRRELNIPFNPCIASIRYDQSMGQLGVLPSFICRSSDGVSGPWLGTPSVGLMSETGTTIDGNGVDTNCKATQMPCKVNSVGNQGN